VTGSESYYDWELNLRNKPSNKRKKKNSKKDNNNLGISVEDFKRFVKLWKSKNIIF